MGANTHPRRNLARVLLVTSLMILSFVHSAPRAEESVTVDFDAVTGYAGDPIATGSRGTWSDSVPDSLIMPLKPAMIGGPVTFPNEPDTSVWARAAASGAIVGVTIDGNLGFDHRGHWRQQGDYQEKMLEWKAHVAEVVDSVLVHRVVGTTAVPVHYDIWNEPDLKSNWHPIPQYGDSVALFHDVWREAVGVIREADSLGLALGYSWIAGPSFAGGIVGIDSTYVDNEGHPQDSGVRLDGLLTYCEAHDCWPDILAWHHIAFSDFRAGDDATDLLRWHP